MDFYEKEIETIQGVLKEFNGLPKSEEARKEMIQEYKIRMSQESDLEKLIENTHLINLKFK